MLDFLDTLAIDAKATVSEGYYREVAASKQVQASLRGSILLKKAMPVIAEVKGASPSRGVIRAKLEPGQLAQAMARGGAVGISVLTEPKHFNGALGSVGEVRRSVNLPVLMKDIIVDPIQLNAASIIGANVVLLIQAVFDRGYCSCYLNEMVTRAHSKGLEVLLETHNMNEFMRAVKTEADLVGINNRNLGTLKVDLDVTKNLLANCSRNCKVVVSESGISTTADLRFLWGCGAQAFLVGSSIMLTDNVEGKVREFVNA
jgi:indole-3-glycerol phosphate synthase